LAYITSKYTDISISYILSQHIGNIDIIIIKTKKKHVPHLDLKNMYTHIYIYIGLSGHPNVYIQKIYRPTGPCRILVYKIGSPAYQKGTKIPHTIRGPLGHPQLPLPQEAVVAHPHLPQAVVVEHPQDHPAQAAVVHLSSQRAQLLAA
jgi:hypothetical protein